MLAELYGGPLGFPPRCLYANFVSSIDGVVAGEGIAPGMISLRSEADRFVMGFLRACAHAVLIGAGTLRAERGHRWTPTHVYPAASDAFARLRMALGYAPDPALVVVTASGRLGDSFDAFVPGSMVVTTRPGAKALAGRLPRGVEVVALKGGDGPISARDLPPLLADRGHLRVLTEGGPRLLGELLAAGLVDELFLTVSPVLLGGGATAVGLTGSRPLVADGGGPTVSATGDPPVRPPDLPQAALLGVRRHRSHLFLRYGLR